MIRSAAIRCLILLLIVTGNLPLALGADTTSARRELESCYRQMDRAAARLDVHDYMAFAVPDLVAVSDGETFHDRLAFEHHLAEDFNATKKMYTFASTMNRLSVSSDSASVDLTTHLVADTVDSSGQYGPKGVVHRFDIQMRFHHEWKRENGRWHLARLASTGFSGTMDGKPIPTGK